MDWMFSSDPGGKPSEIIASRCLQWSRVSAAAKPQIVKSVTTSRAVFFAMRFPAAFYTETNSTAIDSYEPAADGSITVALVILYRREGGEFGYKDMDETMGPNETAPSDAFLYLLSPVRDPNSYAAQWRERSRRELERARTGRKLRAKIWRNERARARALQTATIVEG